MKKLLILSLALLIPVISISNGIDEPDTIIAQRDYSDHIAIELVNKKIFNVNNKDRYPYFLKIKIKLNYPDKNGFPTRAESYELNGIQDVIEKALHKVTAYKYVGRESNSGERYIFYYLEQPDALRAHLNTLNNQFHHKWGYEITKDLKWKLLSKKFGDIMSTAIAKDKLTNTKINQFWKWFYANQNDLKKLKKELQKGLDSIGPGLVYQIRSNKISNRYELIISANDDVTLFAMVNKTVQLSPRMENWNIVAFRQPTQGMKSITYAGKKYFLQDFYYTATKIINRYDLNIYVARDDFNEDKSIKPVVALLLDTLLGELKATNDVRKINIMPYHKNISEARPIFSLLKNLS